METPISSSSPSIQTNSCITLKSRFQTTVCLDDWWLVKAEIDDLQGIRITIGGRSVGNGVKGKQPMRVFSSLPILKRYDMFTLETTDGKCVIIKGFINKDRSAENGFPSDVLNHFMYGFPSYWKEYSEKFMFIESGGKVVSSVIEKLSPPHVGSCDNNIELQDPTNANSVEIEEKTLPKEEILSHTDSIRRNYSTRSSKLRMNKTSAKSGGNEKIKSNSVTSSTRPDKVELARVHIEPGGGINQKKFEQIAKTTDLEENPKAVKTHGIKHKEMQKRTSSLSTISTAYNEKQTDVAGSSSESAKASNKKSRKKIAHETPAKEKDEVPTDSPQYRSLNRSRSGRLLMPPLEFWRNQRKIQEADGTVIGIEEEIREGQPKMGEISRSPFVRYRKI